MIERRTVNVAGDGILESKLGPSMDYEAYNRVEKGLGIPLRLLWRIERCNIHVNNGLFPYQVKYVHVSAIDHR